MLSRQFIVKCKFGQVFLRSYHKIGVIGVPFHAGQPKSGTDKGPKALRDSGLLKDISALNPKIDIKDYGDILCSTQNKKCDVENLLNWSQVAECNRKLSEQVGNIINDGRICLTLGGDHSIGFGTVSGHARTREGDIAVLWIDAHADLNNCRSSPTGNVHGMPMGLIAKELSEEWPALPFMEWHKPTFSLQNLAYIGLRAVDSYERHIIDKFNIAAFDMKDVQVYGIHNVIRMALHKIDPDSKRSLHVSFDIDSLDPLEAPSTGTAVRGGLTLREGIEIMETVSETGRMRALDLVEVNPLIGSPNDVNITLQAGKEVLLAAFGNKRKGIKL